MSVEMWWKPLAAKVYFAVEEREDMKNTVKLHQQSFSSGKVCH